MRTVQVKVPDEVDLKDYELSMMLSSKLYEEGKPSAGQAVKMAGFTKRAFIEVLGKYGESGFSTSVADLHSEIANA